MTPVPKLRGRVTKHLVLPWLCPPPHRPRLPPNFIQQELQTPTGDYETLGGRTASPALWQERAQPRAGEKALHSEAAAPGRGGGRTGRTLRRARHRRIPEMLCRSRAARGRLHLPPEPEAFYRGGQAGKRAQDRDRGGSEGVRPGRGPPPELEGDVSSAPKTAAILRAESVPRVGGPLLRHRSSFATTPSFSTGVLPLSRKPGFRGPGRGHQAAPQPPGKRRVPSSPPPAPLPTLVLRSPGPESL